MTASAANGERDALTFFLAAQRASVLAIVEGLSDDQLNQSVVPSGWTLAGLIEHLGDAERAWSHGCLAAGSLPGGRVERDTDRTDADGTTFRSRRGATALAYYAAQAARTDAILAATELDARPAAPPVVDIGIAADTITVRDVVLHLIEETARHAGHLDIARELIDGRTGLGPR
jgi:uncharacterized damage-inducible protein DinB